MTQLEDTDTNRVVGSTLAEGERKEKNAGYQWDFGELVAKEKGMGYVFLDYVFDTTSLHGAVGSTMVPVTQEEFDRRLEEYKDPKWSPISHIFEEEKDCGDIPKDETWEEWISRWEYDLPDLVLDDSYAYRYGDAVLDQYEEETGVRAEYVECIGGGRCFHLDRGRYEEIYREDLLTLIEYAETHGLTDFF